jgi:acyl phosphate:glycerol-3-phosphate acyltransferase
MLTPILIALAVGYLLGSLPFGYLVARSKGVNIFEVGSKNPGATNVRRVLGHGPGNLVLALDALKGAAAAAWPLLPTANITDPETIGIVGLVAAILGHSFSCFTGFKGGKSVATGAGGFLVLFPVGMTIGLVIFGVVVLVTRYISLGSMIAAASLPISAFLLHRSLVLISIAGVIALFVIIRHRANISRLLAGTESKIGQKKSTATSPPSEAANKS